MKKRLVCSLLVLSIAVSLSACGAKSDNVATESVAVENKAELIIEGATYIYLSDDNITVNGDSVTTDKGEAVYVANDIVYYEEGKDFTYGEGSEADAHSKAEADKHTVIHISKPGTYVVSGKLEAGQIAVDLGEDVKDDPNAVVNLVLNNVDITCSVAPGVIFYNVYECSSSKEEDATKEEDTTAAGANVIIADGSVNTVNGSYVARIYKSVELSEDGSKVVDSKKLHKYDGAFYSKMSMNINGGEMGDGILNINAKNEGLDSELHLTINGGQINIISGNDGINTNEDGVSVTTVNGGYLSIKVDGSTGEGDGIDSNGWLVINDGVVAASACASSADAGIDSDKGIHINGGTVIATGNMLDHISESEQNYVVFTFRDKVKGGEEVVLKKGEEEDFLTMPNDFSYLIISNPSLVEGTYTLWKEEEQLSVVESTDGMGMMMPGGFTPGEMPEGFEPGQMPEGFMPGEMPEGFEPGQMPEGFMPGEMPEGFTQGRMKEGFQNGERPKRAEGENRKERPERVEGENRKERPEGDFGGRFNNQINMEDAMTEFEIKNGGNMFMVVNLNKRA